MRLFAALVLLLVSVTASEAAPNVVVIMTDDQEDTGSMAYMPKLHALLTEQGLTFTNSFVNLPLCAPEPRLLLHRALCSQYRHQGQQPRRWGRLGGLQGQGG